MSTGASHYPISQFLLKLLEQTGLGRDGLVLVLGYRNLERGRRRLDSWMDRGEGYERIIKQIAAAYPGHAEELTKAVAATADMKVAESEAAFLKRCKAEEATFVPFIHAEGESSIPNGITMFGVSGGHHRWTRIEIPQNILDLPVHEQLSKLPELMIAYKRRYNNACPFFGRLTGFKFVRLTDYFQFDAEGQVVEHVERPFRHGEYWVELV